MSSFRSRMIFIIVFGALSVSYKPIGSANEITDYQAGLRQGAWLIRASALKVRPIVEESDLPGLGGRITAPEKYLPGLDVSYFLTDNWAVELQGGVFENTYSLKDSALGSFPIGKVASNTVSAVLQYHFSLVGPIKPYLGMGVNRSWTRSVKPAANVPDFKVGAITSLVFNAGLDVNLAKHWVLNASARYVVSPAHDFEGDGVQATVRVNTLVMGAGVGFYF